MVTMPYFENSDIEHQNEACSVKCVQGIPAF